MRDQVFIPSAFQQAIYNAVENTRDCIIVQAVAGSGKTSTLKGIIERIPPSRRYIYLAFNASIAGEMKKAGYNARTLNSLGAQAIMRAGINGKKPQGAPNSDKPVDILRTIVSPEDFRLYAGAVKKLVGLAKGIGLVPNDPQINKIGLARLTDDNDAVWYDLMDRYNIDLDSEQADPAKLIGLCRNVLARNILMVSVIDFDDQKYFPVIYSLPVEAYHDVLLDETQDLNRLDRALVRMAMRKGSRLIAVGDRAQAIYGWRGADIYSMDRVKEEFRCVEFPLSICYRCPSDVVELAKQYVPHIQARENAPKGVVQTLGKYTTESFRPGDMVLCRNNAPLVSLAYKLIARRVKNVRVLGREIGAGLVNIVRERAKRIRNVDNEVLALIPLLEEWRMAEIQKAEATNSEQKVARISDQYDTIMVFVSSTETTSISDLCTEMMSMFQDRGDKANSVTLSSIHKCKGDEAERVHILDWHLCPSKMARSDEAKMQEFNLMYVALTRSKRELYFIDSELFE